MYYIHAVLFERLRDRLLWHGKRPYEGCQHLLLEDRVDRKRRLRLCITKRDADVMTVTDRLEGKIARPRRAQPFLGARKLKLALFAQIVVDGVLQAVEDSRRKNVHSEETEVHAMQQAGLLQMAGRVLRRRLFVDGGHVVDRGLLTDALATDGSEKMEQFGGRLLDR